MMAAASAWAQSDFEKSAAYNKLDLRARSAWREAIQSGRKEQQLSCLIKVEKSMSQGQKNELAGSGFQPGTIIQKIVTGKIAAKDVPALASLDFVKVVELAMPMNIKKDPAYRKYGAPRVKPKAKTADVKKADTVKSTEEAKKTEKEEGEVPQAQPVEPVKSLQVTTEVPIYQTPPSETPDPNKPRTSPEIPSKQPAIAPVDQAPTVVEPKITPTQPAYQPAAPSPEVGAEVQAK